MKGEGAGKTSWGSKQLVTSLDFILKTTESFDEWDIQPQRCPSSYGGGSFPSLLCPQQPLGQAVASSLPLAVSLGQTCWGGAPAALRGEEQIRVFDSSSRRIMTWGSRRWKAICCWVLCFFSSSRNLDR